MKRFNENDFLLDLKSIPWDTTYIFDSVDDLWEH